MKSKNHDIDTVQVSDECAKCLTMIQRLGNKVGANQAVIDRAAEILQYLVSTLILQPSSSNPSFQARCSLFVSSKHQILVTSEGRRPQT